MPQDQKFEIPQELRQLAEENVERLKEAVGVQIERNLNKVERTKQMLRVAAEVVKLRTEAERVAEAFVQARQIFPELANSFEGGVSHCWAQDPWQRGAFALHTPGQIAFLDTLAQAEGRVHFAGEHTSLWTGWMQGALESARRVVREINA